MMDSKHRLIHRAFPLELKVEYTVGPLDLHKAQEQTRTNNHTRKILLMQQL